MAEPNANPNAGPPRPPYSQMNDPGFNRPMMGGHYPGPGMQPGPLNGPGAPPNMGRGMPPPQMGMPPMGNMPPKPGMMRPPQMGVPPNVSNTSSMPLGMPPNSMNMHNSAGMQPVSSSSGMPPNAMMPPTSMGMPYNGSMPPTSMGAPGSQPGTYGPMGSGQYPSFNNVPGPGFMGQNQGTPPPIGASRTPPPPKFSGPSQSYTPPAPSNIGGGLAPPEQNLQRSNSTPIMGPGAEGGSPQPSMVNGTPIQSGGSPRPPGPPMMNGPPRPGQPMPPQPHIPGQPPMGTHNMPPRPPMMGQLPVMGMPPTRPGMPPGPPPMGTQPGGPRPPPMLRPPTWVNGQQGSEPPSQKSSRGPSPVPTGTYDALEGQWSAQKGGQTPQSPPGPYPPTSSGLPTQLQQPNAPTPPPSGGIAGRRQYPQMTGYSQAAQPPASFLPGQNAVAGQPQPGMMQPGMMQPGMTQPGMTQPSMTQPGMVQPGMMQPGMTPPGMMPNSTSSNMSNQAPQQPHYNNATLNASFNNLKLQPMDGRPINLLQERLILPPEGLETPRPNMPHDYKKANCNPDVFRCTISAMPQSSSLLQKSRLPLGILIHPFRDLSQLPVIQSSVIVRCRSCRTYINPFVSFVDMRRWKCNLCYRVNELPEEFNYDPVSRTYGEPQRRPEIRSATIEFIAPSEYMLRPPQPAVYLYVLDVSFNAISTGYLSTFCATLLEEFDRIPGDARTQIGFITFDRSLHFYNLAEGLSQPQMMVVSDVDEVFLPCPDNLLVNLQESKELIQDLLQRLPTMFEKNMESGCALGPALQAAYKLMSPTGGRVAVFQTQLPTVGPGALKNREDPNERAGKNVNHIGPATDFYKKLSLDCSAQQIAVDLFMMNTQYADVASVGCISKYSGGSLHYFPNLHTVNNPSETDRFEGTLRRYFTRKIGFEAVMRIRCTRGLSIHTFHGNFFVRSTDLLSLPNINPDSGYGMQMSIEDNIDSSTCCFQAALLYTSSRGERRIRVHTLCMPVVSTLQDVYNAADQTAIIGLLTKMGVDKCISSSMSDAREAMINAIVDMVTAHGSLLTAAQRLGQLPVPFSLRLMPLHVFSMLKYCGFRIGASTKLDDRVHALEQCKTLPLMYLMQELYPNLYPVHALDDKQAISKGETIIPKPPLLQLSSANIDRHGAYVLDTGSRLYLWIGASISDRFCQEALNVPNFAAIQEVHELPELENETSDRLRTFISYLNDQRPFPAAFRLIREDSRQRNLFLQHMVEDRTESSMSYYEFLQHVQKEAKS